MSEGKNRLGTRLGWFFGLYCLGALAVGLLAYGIRLWVGG